MLLEHGAIHSIEAKTDADGCPILARVLPSTSDAAPTRPLTIPWWLRGTLGDLEVGVDVVFAVFDDLSGMILARADGEGGKVFPWDVEIREHKLTSRSAVVNDIVVETHRHDTGEGTTSLPHN